MAKAFAKTPTIILIVLFCAFAFAGIAGEAVNETASKQALLNTIHSQELKKIMRRLDMLAYESEYTALELESMRISQINRLIEFADALTKTADNLPRITDQSLSHEDKITFKAMASQLYADSVRLKSEAAEKNYHNMNSRYQKLRQTCNSCHRLFRENK